ncbi:MAG: nuclear transport factor 2 family protein, partial [Bacteroidota bacterium]
AWEWDIAAGALIVAEAGGRAIDRQGDALRFNNPTPQVDGVQFAAERTQIFRTLNYHFEGVNLHVMQAINKAFHPDAHLTYLNSDSGTHQELTVKDYIHKVHSKDAVNFNRSLRIMDLDINGSTAMVKARIIDKAEGSKATEYISLVKSHNEWRIISLTSYLES